MIAERVDHAERHVGQRAHGQRDLLVAQPGDQSGILHGPHPVVDALHPEQVERLAHVVRAALLARVGHQPQTFGRRQLVYLGEQRRRVADLGRVESDADELVPERQTGPQHRVGGVRAQVAQEARDRGGGDPVVPAPSASAAVSPPKSSPSGTPLARCVCGSKKISARRTPAAAARAR